MTLRGSLTLPGGTKPGRAQEKWGRQLKEEPGSADVLSSLNAKRPNGGAPHPGESMAPGRAARAPDHAGSPRVDFHVFLP